MPAVRSDKVLVLGSNRTALSITRSLGKHGIDVDIGYEPSNEGVAEYSRYCRRSFEFHEPDGMARFKSRLGELLRHENYDLVIPVSVDYIEGLISFREELEEYSGLAVPTADKWEKTRDKLKTAEIIESCGIPYPETVVLGAQNTYEPEKLEKLGWPIVLKKVDGIGAENLCHVQSLEELEDRIDSFSEEAGIIAQEFVDGKIIDVDILASNGQIVAAFQAERTHIPVHGGPSTYRRSMKLDPELLRNTEKICQELNWNGVAQLEYIVNKEEKIFLR